MYTPNLGTCLEGVSPEVNHNFGSASKGGLAFKVDQLFLFKWQAATPSSESDHSVIAFFHIDEKIIELPENIARCVLLLRHKMTKWPALQ